MFNKPPIVEMWVEFKFDPNPDPRVESAVAFLQEFATEFPKITVGEENLFEFRQVSQKKIPELLWSVAVKHLRTHDADEFRWMHLTQTQLVCTFLRLGEKYPGFEALSHEAVSKFKRYVEVCQPAKLRYTAVHYVDVIDIPVPASGSINLADYFTLGVDLPRDPFGNQVSFLVRTQVVPTDGTGPMEVQLQLDSLVEGARAFRFRLDWHKQCPYDGEIDLERIPVALKLAHESVMRCFPKAFTAATWELFEPKE